MPAIPLPITTSFCLITFSSIICLSNSDDTARDATCAIDRSNRDWEFGEPIRGQMTVINGGRHSLGYKTRANLATQLPQAISIGLRTAASVGCYTHRTKKHHPARFCGVVCCPRRQDGISAAVVKKRQRIAITGEVPRTIGWHGYCCL